MLNIQDLLEDNIRTVCGFLDRFSAIVLCMTLKIKPRNNPKSINGREKLKQDLKIASTIQSISTICCIQQLDTDHDLITFAQYSPEFVQTFPKYIQHIHKLISYAAYHDNIELFEYLTTKYPSRIFNIVWVKIISESMLKKILAIPLHKHRNYLEAVLLGGDINAIKCLKKRRKLLAQPISVEVLHGATHVNTLLQMNFVKSKRAYYAAIYNNDLAMMQYLYDLDFPLTEITETGTLQSFTVDVNKTINCNVPLCDFAAELDRMAILEWLFQHDQRGSHITTVHLAAHNRWDELSQVIKIHKHKYSQLTIMQLAIKNKFEMLWELVQCNPRLVVAGVLYHAVMHKSIYLERLYDLLPLSHSLSAMAIAATESGNNTILKKIDREHILPITYCFTTDTSTLQWLYDQDIRFKEFRINTGNVKINVSATLATRIAAELQQLPALEWMLRNDFPFDPNEILKAAGDKAPVILAWFRRKIDHMT
jgi:hypothetical protein